MPFYKIKSCELTMSIFLVSKWFHQVNGIAKIKSRYIMEAAKGVLNGMFLTYLWCKF